MKFLTLSVAAVLWMTLSSASMAQIDHNTLHSAVPPKPATTASREGLADALVKKVDKTKGTVTLAHGALPNGMPPMTMAYKVKDAAWLDTLQAGQKIRFATDPADGGMTVSHMELAK
jgi:Cu/Ag efflux protein CusF